MKGRPNKFFASKKHDLRNVVAIELGQCSRQSCHRNRRTKRQRAEERKRESLFDKIRNERSPESSL